jgi:hypothetical protein
MVKKSTADKITAWATLALAVVTTVMACATCKLASDSKESSQRQIGVETWLDFEKRFDSTEMLRARKTLAKQLQSDPTSKDVVISERVMDFFEDLGVAYRLGYVNKELAILLLGGMSAGGMRRRNHTLTHSKRETAVTNQFISNSRTWRPRCASQVKKSTIWH